MTRPVDGREPFAGWIRSLRELHVRARIEQRVGRLKGGNFGDCKPLKDADACMSFAWILAPDIGCISG